MRYRAFRYNGQFTNALMTVAGDEFSVAPESHQADISSALGIPFVDLEVVEGDTDPRDAGPFLELPVSPPSPQDEARERYLTAVVANKDTAPWGRILYDLAVADGLIEA